MATQTEWGNKHLVALGIVRLPNTPARAVLHNHGAVSQVVYAGMGDRGLPAYHLWRCEATSNPPKHPPTLYVYEPMWCTPSTPEYEGNCSTPKCSGDAYLVDSPREGEVTTYCVDCAARAQGVVPCPWTLTLTCRRELVGDDCATCETEEVIV